MRPRVFSGRARLLPMFARRRRERYRIRRGDADRELKPHLDSGSVMQNAAWALLLTVVAAAPAIGQTTPEGEIGGHITDSLAAPLTGVRITISSGDERRETTTDNDG